MFCPSRREFFHFVRSNLPHIVQNFPTPFHVYDREGILETCREMRAAFVGGTGYNNYFAVKALPNPEILRLMHDLGFGFDCSSIPELMLARNVGVSPDKIMFTANNVSNEEFVYALAQGGCILNLDDITCLNRLRGGLPEGICFRYNPGKRRTGNSIIGNPSEAKYGITHEQFLPAYRKAQRMGVSRFGIHTMVCSNQLTNQYFVDTVVMLLKQCALLHKELGIQCEFINMGGGFGIPYHPHQVKLDIKWIGEQIVRKMLAFESRHGFSPRLLTECGRYVTGPHGLLVSRVITKTEKYHSFIGVDSGMPALMRPAIYDAYHHNVIVTPRGRLRGGALKRAHIVGSICENCDRLTTKEGQDLPTSVQVGDYVITFCTGAHAIAMGFNYNGRLRPAELLASVRGSAVKLIRRAETPQDLFGTLSGFPEATSVFLG